MDHAANALLNASEQLINMDQLIRCSWIIESKANEAFLWPSTTLRTPLQMTLRTHMRRMRRINYFIFKRPTQIHFSLSLSLR